MGGTAYLANQDFMVCQEETGTMGYPERMEYREETARMGLMVSYIRNWNKISKKLYHQIFLLQSKVSLYLLWEDFNIAFYFIGMKGDRGPPGPQGPSGPKGESRLMSCFKSTRTITDTSNYYYLIRSNWTKRKTWQARNPRDTRNSRNHSLEDHGWAKRHLSGTSFHCWWVYLVKITANSSLHLPHPLHSWLFFMQC